MPVLYNKLSLTRKELVVSSNAKSEPETAKKALKSHLKTEVTSSFDD